MKILNSDTSVPLYQQLKEIIKNDIQNGTYNKNEKIPTEQALSQMYQVSRITVRKALDELTREQLLIRRPGKGTFIAGEKLTRSIKGIQSFTDICLQAGKKPGARVVKAALESATPDDREKLALGQDAHVVAIERLRFADDKPVSYDICHLPQKYSFLLSEDLNDCSMFEILKNKYGVEFIHSEKNIQLIYATSFLAKQLNLSVGHPLISISALSLDSENHPAHYSTQLIVGDQFTFTL